VNFQDHPHFQEIQKILARPRDSRTKSAERAESRRVFNFSELEPEALEALVDERPHAEDLLCEAQLESRMREVISKLTTGVSQRQRDVLQGRFHEDKALHEIGEEMQLSRERVRQIEVKTLEVCRNRTHGLFQGVFEDWLLTEIQCLAASPALEKALEKARLKAKGDAYWESLKANHEVREKKPKVFSWETSPSQEREDEALRRWMAQRRKEKPTPKPKLQNFQPRGGNFKASKGLSGYRHKIPKRESSRPWVKATHIFVLHGSHGVHCELHVRVKDLGNGDAKAHEENGIEWETISGINNNNWRCKVRRILRIREVLKVEPASSGRCKRCNTWRTKEPSGICLLCQGATTLGAS